MPLLIFIIFIFSLLNGTIEISFLNILKMLFGNKKMLTEDIIVIIKQIRLPRTIMSCVTGAGLSISGCVFQAILKNPLADPFTLGISSGAAFGTTLAFVLGLDTMASFFMPLCAFIGMICSIFIIYLLNMKNKFNSNSMILSGVVVSYIFSAAVMFMFILSPTNSVQSAFIWLMGGNLSTFDERLLPFVIVVVIVGTIILSLLGNIINIISLNIEKSETLGINVAKNVKFLFIMASFVTAVTVSACGIIAFIGLIVPHIMRKIIGSNNVILIPASAFAGAIFLQLCDTLSRTLFSPILIPIGIVTSVIGGIFFICLLLKSEKY
jgi:iron complex transport system permease protein